MIKIENEDLPDQPFWRRVEGFLRRHWATVQTAVSVAGQVVRTFL
ncbi:hypothetical protein ACWC5I_10335 [Kitasatospora sp. NPDC001574]